MRVSVLLGMLTVVVVLTGCEQKPPAQPAANLPPVPTLPTVPQPPVVPQPAPPPATETVVAEVGVGQKGRSLDEHEGVYVTPVKTIWSTREFLAFNALVPQALQLYEAEHGNRPKTHEEFMEKIIKLNQIRLPELPPGQTYKWDPMQGDKGELMVVRPKNSTTPGFTATP